MPIWLGTIHATSEDLYYSKTYPFYHFFSSSIVNEKIEKGSNKHVDLEVGTHHEGGIKISFGNNRDMFIIDSNYQLIFTTNFTEDDVILNIKNTWFQGAASFDVERKNNSFIIRNNDKRLVYLDDPFPSDNYRIYTSTRRGMIM